MNKSKVQIYFYIILFISIVWLFLLPKPLKNFAPIIFGIPTFPVFAFCYFNKLHDFSRKLKIENPDLFSKTVADYGSTYNNGLIVDIGLFSKNKEFENLKDIHLYEMYVLCKELIKLTSISFLIIALLGIGTVYL